MSEDQGIDVVAIRQQTGLSDEEWACLVPYIVGERNQRALFLALPSDAPERKLPTTDAKSLASFKALCRAGYLEEVATVKRGPKKPKRAVYRLGTDRSYLEGFDAATAVMEGLRHLWLTCPLAQAVTAVAEAIRSLLVTEWSERNSFRAAVPCVLYVGAGPRSRLVVIGENGYDCVVIYPECGSSEGLSPGRIQMQYLDVDYDGVTQYLAYLEAARNLLHRESVVALRRCHESILLNIAKGTDTDHIPRFILERARWLAKRSATPLRGESDRAAYCDALLLHIDMSPYLNWIWDQPEYWSLDVLASMRDSYRAIRADARYPV